MSLAWMSCYGDDDTSKSNDYSITICLQNQTNEPLHNNSSSRIQKLNKKGT